MTEIKVDFNREDIKRNIEKWYLPTLSKQIKKRIFRDLDKLSADNILYSLPKRNVRRKDFSNELQYRVAKANNVMLLEGKWRVFIIKDYRNKDRNMLSGNVYYIAVHIRTSYEAKVYFSSHRTARVLIVKKRKEVKNET